MTDSKKIIDDLFNSAKKQDEFAYIFALLGINSGIEDIGWQPISETWNLFQDLISIANTPLQIHTQIRLMLLAYCQITEASYIYHVIYNMLLCAEGEIPKVFNFLDQYKNGIPPSVKTKLKLIEAKAARNGHESIAEKMKSIFDASLRNAVSHADFILYQNEVRLKHKGNEIRAIKLQDIVSLMNSTSEFFQTFFNTLDEHKRSYENGYLISDRRNKLGHNLASITLKVDKGGNLVGFSSSDPLPMW